jgi:hypothetical protein
MTDFEFLELYYNTQSMATGINAFYLSLLSGYLITAQIVGARLTTFQVGFISTAYTGFQLLSIFGMWQAMLSGEHYLRSATEIPQALSNDMQLLSAIYAYVVFMLVCLVGSLIYMWTKRSSKSS